MENLRNNVKHEWKKNIFVEMLSVIENEMKLLNVHNSQWKFQ